MGRRGGRAAVVWVAAVVVVDGALAAGTVDVADTAGTAAVDAGLGVVVEGSPAEAGLDAAWEIAVGSQAAWEVDVVSVTSMERMLAVASAAENKGYSFVMAALVRRVVGLVRTAGIARHCAAAMAATVVHRLQAGGGSDLAN